MSKKKRRAAHGAADRSPGSSAAEDAEEPRWAAADEPRGPGLVGYLRWVTVGTWRRSDARALAHRQARATEGLGPDWRPAATLVLGALVLTALHYLGKGEGFDGYAQRFVDADWAADRLSPIYRANEKLWWTGWRIGGYLVVPALFIKLALRERLRDHGLSTEGFSNHLAIYGVCLCVVLPLVALVSYEPTFQSKYPMYQLAGRSLSDLLWWESLYALQFFSLEFFFRGHWLEMLERTMGSHAIFAMMVPYCLIHFGKPWPETVGAIVAGLALGTLALRYRSIWAGFLVHVSVAVSMDVASLLQRGEFPSQW